MEKTKMARRTRLAITNERGEIASSLIIFVVVVGFFMLTVHAMFVFHGNNVIKAAAQDTLAEAQNTMADVVSPDLTKARQVGIDRLELFPGLTDRDVRIQVFPATNTIAVTVTAKIKTPFLVDANADLGTTVVGPIEQFYEQFERDG